MWVWTKIAEADWKRRHPNAFHKRKAGEVALICGEKPTLEDLKALKERKLVESTTGESLLYSNKTLKMYEAIILANIGKKELTREVINARWKIINALRAENVCITKIAKVLHIKPPTLAGFIKDYAKYNREAVA